MKKLIWLTGGSGAGKSMAAEIIREMDIFVVDADAVSKQILSKGSRAVEEVIHAFGGGILLPCGEINRKELGKIVFSDSEKLAVLNNITHKYIKAQIDKEIEGAKGMVVVDAPLPPKSFANPDAVIAVVADDEIRLKRIVLRDSISYENAKNRLKSQISQKEYIKGADYVIINEGTPNDLQEEVKRVIKLIYSGDME